MPSIKQITTKLYKHYSGVCDTRTNRDFFEESITSAFSVNPNQLLMYADQIPKPTSRQDDTYTKIKNFQDGDVWTWQKDESTYIPVFTKHVNYPLTKIDDGTDNSFKLVDENGNAIQNIIPFNYALDLYNYYLTTDNGDRIYFGVGDWHLDTFSGVLTFYGDLPDGVDHNHPPKITFYQYTGGTGFRQDTYGYDGAALPLENWHIPKGVYLVDYNSNNEESLYSHICKVASRVEDGFAATYGWDGADKNEGIALSLEKIIALEYTFTKDKVKGYDDSLDAEIGTLLSDKIPELSDQNSKFNVTFASQGLLKDTNYKIVVSQGQASFEGGKAKSITKGVYKLPSGEQDAFIIIDANGTPEDGEYTFTVEENPEKVRALLLYWNKTTQEYLPFITKDENNCNFGFAIVAINGKIPPSVTMDSAAISAYSDSITPDYYGPRNYSVTVAVEGEYSTKSADYVVKNITSFYLNDIINRIKSDFTIEDKLQFKGTIFLRAGTYILNDDINLSQFENLALVGEPGQEVIIKSLNNEKTITYNNAELEGVILLRDLIFADVNLNIKAAKETIFIRYINSNKSLKVESENNNISISNVSFLDITLKNGSEDEESSDKILVELNHSNSKTLTVDSAKTFVNTCFANEATFKDHRQVFVTSCVFFSVLEKPKDVQFRSCRVNKFAATISRQDIPNPGMFPIYSKSNDQYLQYAAFENYFTYNEETNRIELNIDAEYLHYQAVEGEDGKYELSIHISADQIKVDNTYQRDPNYDGELTQTGGNLQGALKDLYLTKADLVSGKVPLTELPDSVAYGGLLYIGSWSFDENNGEYPTFEGTIEDHPYLSLDLKVDENKLQPGWFWVVSESKELSVDNPVSDQPSVVQYRFEDGKLKVLATTLGETIVKKLEHLTEDEVNRLLKAANATPEEVAADPSLTLSDEDKNIVKYLSSGGLVFTAGDWVIWNGSYFEKLDRAYQDPVFSILPVYTTGDNSDSASGRISWYWRTSREFFDNGWGLGALDLGKKTIGEAFDQVNQELKRLQVKHPANISSIKLTPVKDYAKTKYVEVSDNNIVATTESEAYDCNIDKSILRFSVQTPQIDDWKNLIYFGDEGVITGYIDPKELENPDVDETNYKEAHLITKNSDETSLKFVGSKQDSFMVISKPIDPYKDEFIGEGYFNGVKIKIIPKNDLTIGNHSFSIGVSDIKPNNPNFMAGVVGVTEDLNIKIIKPYLLDQAEVDGEEDRRFAVVTPITNAEKAGYCSGIKSIKIKDNPFTFNLTYRIKCALTNMLNIDDTKRIMVYSNINETLEKPQGLSIVKNIDNNAGYKDFNFINSPYSVQSDLFWDKFVFNAVIYDVYGNAKTFPNIFKFNIRFDPTTESERVFSGAGLYPVYTPSRKGQCGNADWDSSKTLDNGVYVNELQKVGRSVIKGDNKYCASEYKWPSGRYNEYTDGSITDYSKIDTGVEIGEDIYRFVTLTKFGENKLETVELDANSGFTLKFNIEDDNLKYWTADKYSMVTNNIIIQAKIIDPNVESNDPSIIKWIDCNAPFDGFLLVGSEDGDEAMYAGSSSAIEKRITFGRNVYSGKLIIRIGIKKDSNMAFKSITIKDLI